MKKGVINSTGEKLSPVEEKLSNNKSAPIKDISVTIKKIEYESLKKLARVGEVLLAKVNQHAIKDKTIEMKVTLIPVERDNITEVIITKPPVNAATFLINKTSPHIEFFDLREQK